MLPELPGSAIREALSRFDAELRDSPEWKGWERRESYRYAILHEGQRYPVKCIVSLATGVPVSAFSGGEEANGYVTARGFTITRLTSEAAVSQSVAFTPEHFELFQRHPTRRPWAEIPEADRESYRSLRAQLKDLSTTTAAQFAAATPMRGFQSHPTPNGRNATDLWCCIFPSSVDNKSFALQFALIVSAAGLEICFGLGAGTAQVSQESLTALQSELLRLKSELTQLDPVFIDRLETLLAPERWQYRRSWRQPPGTSDFTSLRDWLRYAASPQGDSASISLNLTPGEAVALGDQSTDAFLRWGNTFAPVFDRVYAAGTANAAQTQRAEVSAERETDRLTGQRVWLISPGERARLWPEFVSEQIIAIGWDDIGDLRQFHDKQAIAAAMREAYDRDTSPTNDAQACFEFSQVMQPGDLVFAKQGTRTLVGVGVIKGDYEFRQERKEFKSIRRVEWTAIGPWHLPTGTRLVIKTLTDLSSYPDYVDQLRALTQGTSASEAGIVVAEPPDYTLEQFVTDTGIALDVAVSWLSRLRRKKQVVFQGPPGTGKTFVAERLAWVLASEGEGFVDVIQLHPAYTYEDFILGIRPRVEMGTLTFGYQAGRFLRFCEDARQVGGESPCVILLDEFNRANLPQVLGELLYLLEYRDRRIALAGSEMELAIPPNVYVIGTMNTADRSVALVDHALRRRFTFITLTPDYDVLAAYLARHGLNATPLIHALRTINAAIDDPHYALGISFFMKDGAALPGALEDIWKGEIEPYLEEYFYDSHAKVDAFRWGQLRDSLQHVDSRIS